MERVYDSKPNRRYPVDNRCVDGRMGRLYTGERSPGIVDTRSQFQKFELERNGSRVLFNESFPSRSSREDGASFVGQYCHCSKYQFSRRSEQRFDSNSICNLDRSFEKQCNINSQISGGNREFPRRLSLAENRSNGLDVKSTPISLPRQSMGATYHRPLCFNDKPSTVGIQQSVFRSSDTWGGLLDSKGLAGTQQFCKSPILHYSTDFKSDTRTEGGCNVNRAILEIKNVVTNIKKSVNKSTDQTQTLKSRMCKLGSASRAFEKSSLENIRLEDIWERKLRSQGWSDRAIVQVRLSWAKSTFDQYNRYVLKFKTFCEINNIVFPPDTENSCVFSDFLCSIADESERPESLLKMCSAALSCLYNGLDQDSPMDNCDIKRLLSGLVKSSTKRPAKRTEIMPVKPFIDYFRSQSENEDLTLKLLRLKTITLLALSFMTRPSDLAPRAEMFDSANNTVYPCFLSRDNVRFHDDNSVTITFFGVKNDTARTGFEVRIPPSEDAKTDPICALKVYMFRTSDLTSRSGPVFLSLNKPHSAIKSDTVSKILSESINLAGLGDKGYTAKCFRPTAANAAIESGCQPETAMYLGRWKTKEVFFNHYVYPLAPSEYTDGIKKYLGLDYDK